jgi:catechol 2,3-dioxygenase-like lactoylglutathione lyase family enzyme
MEIRFVSVLLFVKDVAASRSFYETILQQKVRYDFGLDIEFESGFAIHDANHISKLLFNRPVAKDTEKLGKDNFELYFECDDLEAVAARLVSKGTLFVHNIKEQPWGQRAFRVYDPDNHIIEIGEPMANVIKRYFKAGLSETEIAEKTSMPLQEIQRIKAEMN